MAEERKLVTILFADVTGSTSLGETLDPEDVRTLMSRYYSHAQHIVSQHNGTLEKFIGDAVMAIFGLPHAHGDDAERALAAALALHEAVRADPFLSGRFLLRMGVNTGEVVGTSDQALGDFLVTGDAVNVAARLQQAASPGEIVAGERTALAAQAAFLFGDMRLLEVKGKQHPLRVFPLLEARAVRLIGRPPLVGRRQDLLQLELLWMRAREERRPQLVSIVAPAGTGKTRLLEEFLAHLDAAEGFKVAIARCLPYGQALTYWPLRGLLAGLLGGELEQLEVTRQKVAAVFARGGYLDQDALRLADCVLTTLGAEREGVIERESIFIAWRLLIEEFARQAPQIVVFEDLHWASESLLDLVEHIMHPRTQTPLLIMVLSRPELLDRRPSWGGGRRNFTSLALEPLSETQTYELVEQVMAGLPLDVRQRLVERSGGNPFFVIELVRGFVERRLSEPAAILETLPDTVHAAVLARLDLLPPQQRAVLQVAAAAGRTFRPAMLQAVLDTTLSSEIEVLLDGLLARNLIVPTEGGAFTFRHILIRDVAYGTLARAERIRMHSNIAHWLEAGAEDRGDEFTELIAYHYREAALLARQAAVPLATPLDSARAVHYLERAGLLASQSGAFVEARAYLQCALDLAPQEEHLRLYEELGDAVVFWGDTAVDPYRRAVAQWRVAGGQPALIGVRLIRKLVAFSLRWISPHSPFWKAHQEELVELLAEAQRLVEIIDDDEECWRLRVAHVWLLNWRAWNGGITREEAEEGRDMALAAAAYFEQRADWGAFSEALDGYGALANGVGAYHDQLGAAKRRLSAPELSLIERGDAVFNRAWAYLNLGDFHHCVESVRGALSQLRPGESVLPLMTSVGMAILALYRSGRWSEITDLVPVLEEAWEQIQHDSSAITTFSRNYFPLLLIALAREDRAAVEAAMSVLHRCVPVEDATGRGVLAAYCENDPRHLDLDPPNSNWIEAILLCLNYYGVAAPQKLIKRVLSDHRGLNLMILGVEIAEALQTEDVARLAAAIDEADSYGLIPTAARMRIVLAQRTADRTHLDRVRPVLEQLEDRRSLRWLEEIEATLGEKG